MSRSTECPDVSADQGRQTHREGHGGHQLWLAADKKKFGSKTTETVKKEAKDGR